jgi:succinate dehydrogenase/fumarate reductase flavoprotein subunit
MAAIRAKELNPDLHVSIVEKAEISRSGSAGRGMDALNNVVIPGVSSVDEYVEAVSIIADGVIDPAISRVIGERSLGILKRLEQWGLSFPRDETGGYIVNQFHPKGRFLVEIRGELKKILARETLSSGAEIYNRHVVLDLIKDRSRIAGAIAFDLSDGSLKAFLAPAVLIAAGGAARIGLNSTGYLHGTFDCPWCNGEAYRLGYDAGARLTGFEYTGIAMMIKDFNCPGLSTFIRHGAWLINGLGERIMERYDPARMEHAPGGVRTKAMLEELKAGRGPVAFSFSHLKERTLDLIESGIYEAERPTVRQFLQRKGIDLRSQPLEVVFSEVYLCGGHGLTGMVADAWGETDVPGLFAAGDCLANPYGFLPGAMCMGEAVGERVVSKAHSRPDDGEVDERLAVLKAAVARHRKGTLNVPVREFEYKYRRLVNEYLAPPKSASRLTRFLKETDAMIKDQDDIPVTDPHSVMKVFEAKAGLFSARLAALASLFRKESRFGLYHERVDYPEKDDANWKTRIILYQGPDGAVVEKERL